MLTGLQEKIFIDRYTLKDNNGSHAKVGDTVMVLLDEGTQAHAQDKSVGEIIKLNDDTVTIKLRDGDEKEFKYDKFSISLETTPEEMWNRLSKNISSVERTPEKQKEWEAKFREVLDDWKLVPGGRIAAGAGTGDELTLFNCYVVPSPDDSRGGIVETFREMTEIMARGGGVGINLSTLRPRRALVQGVNGSSSGSVSWGGLFSYGTGLIEQGGSRRGALMLMLWDWHPDLLEFITIKQSSGSITNANLSVCVSNSFMKAVKEDLDWQFRFPDTKFEKYKEEWDGNIHNWESKGYPVKVYKTMKAREIWHIIVESAYKSAEPGIVFMEYYNNVSNSWYFNPIVCTNPCGEQGLPGWGVCNLSAINLSKFYDEENHDVAWDELAKCVNYGVRFLDNVIDATPYHFEENRANQQNERRIGLGSMGVAELLIKMGIRYGSSESIEFMDKLFEFIAKEAYKASIQLAKEKEPFKAFDVEKHTYNQDANTQTFAGMMIEQLDDDTQKEFYTYGIRNVTVITQAPTGSTGTMVNTSTGIEPYFAFEYYRQSRLGFDKQYVPIAQDWINTHPGQELPDYFVTAQNLSAEDHVRVQAIIQKWVDSSISKTANAPSTFTIEDTKNLYELAYDLGCKGATVYVDGSRDVQVLTTKKKEDKKEEVKVDTPKKLIKRPHELDGKTYKYKTPVGTSYITVNVDDVGKPIETIVNVGKAGSAVSAMAEALGRVSSLFLRFGELPDNNNANLLMDHLSGIGGSEQAMGFGIAKADSIPDAIARAINEELKRDRGLDVKKEIQEQEVIATVPEIKPIKGLDICPMCNKFSLVFEEGCKHCTECGYGRCNG